MLVPTFPRFCKTLKSIDFLCLLMDVFVNLLIILPSSGQEGTCTWLLDFVSDTSLAGAEFLTLKDGTFSCLTTSSISFISVLFLLLTQCLTSLLLSRLETGLLCLPNLMIFLSGNGWLCWDLLRRTVEGESYVQWMQLVLGFSYDRMVLGGEKYKWWHWGSLAGIEELVERMSP